MKYPFKHFNDLTKADICCDWHTHTTQTDGHATPEEMMARAAALKLSSLAFTEHVTRSSSWFAGFKEALVGMKKPARLKVLVGIEAKAVDFHGAIDATPAVIESAELVLGVVHRYPDGNGGLLSLEEMHHLPAEKARDIEFRLALGMLEHNRQIDVLAHPMGVYQKFFHDFPHDELRRLMQKSLEKRIAFEINTKYLTDTDQLFALLRSVNPFVSLGSDAHSTEEIARDFARIIHEVES